jgi:hypothetical protein
MKLLLAALILPAAIVVAIAAFETRVFYPLPANGPTRGIVWDGRTFVSKTDFGRWLRSRGSSYAIWARRHPLRAGLKPKRSTQRLAARNVQARAKAKAESRAKAQDRAMGEKSSGSNGVILAVALAIAALLLGIVLLKRRPRRSLSPRKDVSLPTGVSQRKDVSPRKDVSLQKAFSWAKRVSSRKGISPKQPLEGAVRRGAAVAEGGAHVTLRWAFATAQRSLGLTATAPALARRRRAELAWYLAMALFAAGIGLVVTVWLNGA